MSQTKVMAFKQEILPRMQVVLRRALSATQGAINID
jgi:hypothetical protein